MTLRQESPGDLYHLLMDQVLPDPLFVHDHGGRFLEVNARACASLGYTRTELLAMTVTDIEQDFDLAAAQAIWSSIVEGTTRVQCGRQRRKDGSVFPVEVRFGLLATAGGRRYFGTVHDITERRRTDAQVRDSAARLRSVFQAMAEGLVLQDSAGQIIDANPAAETILGVSRNQLVGKSSLDPGWRSVREDGSPYPGHEHPAMVTLRTGQALRNQLMGVQDPQSGPALDQHQFAADFCRGNARPERRRHHFRRCHRAAAAHRRSADRSRRSAGDPGRRARAHHLVVARLHHSLRQSSGRGQIRRRGRLNRRQARAGDFGGNPVRYRQALHRPGARREAAGAGIDRTASRRLVAAAT